MALRIVVVLLILFALRNFCGNVFYNRTNLYVDLLMIRSLILIENHTSPIFVDEDDD